MHGETRVLGLGGELLERRASDLLVRRPAPVERRDRALVLEPDPDPAQPLPGRRGELPDRLGVALECVGDHGLGAARLEQLGAVRPRVGDPADPNDPAGVERGAPRDAGHEAVSPRQRCQGPRRGGWHPRGVRPLDDRGQSAVDVAEDRGLFGRIG